MHARYVFYGSYTIDSGFLPEINGEQVNEHKAECGNPLHLYLGLNVRF
ncbi:hypothetical protein [uncultured Helicobacter sp.]